MFKEIELVLQGADKIKKIKNKLSLASREKKRGYEEVYLRSTIMILLSNSINHVQRRLVRWAAKKTLCTQSVGGFLSFPPAQQVVLNNQLLFREAVEEHRQSRSRSRERPKTGIGQISSGSSYR